MKNLEVTPPGPQRRDIVFFDGDCHLCNGFVDALITRDKHRRLLFAPLQGETAKQTLSIPDRDNLDTVVYFESGRLFRRSTAALKILFRLGGFYRLCVLGLFVPLFLRDGVYNWIAKNRYSWFGKRDFCRIATAEERAYLLP